MQTPETRYAKSGEVNVAYQVLGEGPLDLVFVYGWISHLDFQWTNPVWARSHVLKGVPGEWRLFAVRAVEARSEAALGLPERDDQIGAFDRLARVMAHRAPGMSRLAGPVGRGRGLQGAWPERYSSRR
jgi:hypothetical protein